MGSSISRAFDPDEQERRERVAELFAALDADGNGTISRAEVHDWVSDERFAGGDGGGGVFSGGSIREVSARVAESLDRDNDDMVTREELELYFAGVPIDDIAEVTRSVRKQSEDARREAVRRVFDALDTDGSGNLSKSEVLFWLGNERRWKEILSDVPGSHEAARELIFRQIDKDASGEVSFEELLSFFSTWRVREVRQFTSNQMVYSLTLQLAERPDDEDVKRRLAEAKAELRRESEERKKKRRERRRARG